MVELEEGNKNSTEASPNVKVYLDVLEDIGPKLYSGKDTWIREYIQNSVDSGAQTINIKLADSDLIIQDDGSGMASEDLFETAFSIGGSHKSGEKIGELGIGMFAAIGICDQMVVLTKKSNGQAFEATFNSKKYRELVESQEVPTFEAGMKEIFTVRPSKADTIENEHFTKIRFENLNTSALENFSFYRMSDLIERNINVPIASSFSHKSNVESFLGHNNPSVIITFNIDGEIVKMERFSNISVNFADAFLREEIKWNGKRVAKVWAVYPKDGTSFVGNRILLKHKGIIVGDETVVKSRFKVDLSSRFLGEIVFLSKDLQINTERNWFVESNELNQTVELVAEFLRKCDIDAETDSSLGNGLLRLNEQFKKNERKLEEARKEQNSGITRQLEQRKENLNRKINDKVSQAKALIEKIDKKRNHSTDPHDRLKSEVVREALRKMPTGTTGDKSKDAIPPPRKRKNPIPEMVKTIVLKYVDEELAPRIKKKDFKDTSQNAYSFIEDLLKERLNVQATPYSSSRYFKLVDKFIEEYRPPFDLSEKDEKQFLENLGYILRSSHYFFRNPSSHTNKLDEMDEPRFILQSVFIADFLIYLVRMMKK